MKLKIGFIGAGNMAEAMIKGLTQGKEQVEVRVTNRSNLQRLVELKDAYGILPSDLTELMAHSETVVITVKPKDVKSLLEQLANFPGAEEKLIISVAAGIPLTLIQGYFPQNPIIRAMPNTSSAVLRSMTGLVKGSAVNTAHLTHVEAIFHTMGNTVWIKEEEMNPFIAMAGSSPAYYYLFTEYLVKAGIELGFSEEVAQILARETLIGAGKMIDESGKSPDQLRQAVTSPNGTTFAALEVFRQGGLDITIAAAVRACVSRAEEMEREYGE